MPACAPSPCFVPAPSSLPCTQPTNTQLSNTLAPPDSSTESAASSQLCSAQLPSTQPEEQAPEVVLLTDSNGKYLDTKRLFPGQRVLFKHCSTTRQAMKLLKRETLNNPQCLVIHTGTDDLHTLHKDTAEAVRKMAEQASEEFPNTRIVISTLLPRTDMPPHVIHDINMEIRRGCAALPNVHLAHHPTIGTWDLYDGLHLHREVVGIFAKTLKDTALGRSPSIPSSTRNFRDWPRPPTHHQPRFSPQPERRHSRSARTFTAQHPPVHSHPPHNHHSTTVKDRQERTPTTGPGTRSHPQHQQDSYGAAPDPIHSISNRAMQQPLAPDPLHSISRAAMEQPLAPEPLHSISRAATEQPLAPDPLHSISNRVMLQLIPGLLPQPLTLLLQSWETSERCCTSCVIASY
ncbi:uncharacterized protein LOC117741650 [Cyclopterus lumpus]|uniref:uncharacterized protein LOC117741650 n=1 Tax=Cyclopterus lumpus TaxID=8103 RepID=UPI001486043B|nr:uncharacterized protein LOC117741650 [Cyclopterus lumpus]